MLKSGGSFYIIHLGSSKEIADFHKRAGGLIQHDTLPAAKDLRQMLADGGFDRVEIEDHPGLFLASGRQRQMTDPAPKPPPLSKTNWVTQTGLFLALAVVLPVGFHAFGIGGRVFLPMHFPVLLAGFLVGPYSGLTVGLMAPLISHLITGMPPTYAVPLMSLELPLYGWWPGWPIETQTEIYIALIAAMIVGRVMFGLGLFVLGMFMELPYTATVFFSTAGPIIAGLPGIIAQIVVIPIIVAAVRRARP